MSDTERQKHQTEKPPIESRFRFEKVAPEGEYGYIIIIALALPMACAWSSLGAFGILFNDFITSRGGESSAMTVVVGSYCSALSFAGFFTSILFKRFTIRSVGIFGGIAYFLGSVLTIFVTSVEQLIVTFGILQGGGIGIMVPVGYTTFNTYFVKRRVLMMSLTQTLIGIGTMVYPILVHHLMEIYGFRGMIAIVAAINGHAVWGMLAMHPVDKHYKIIKVPVETKPLINAEETEQKISVTSEKEDKFIHVDDEHCTKWDGRNDSSDFDSLRRRLSIASVSGCAAVLVSDAPTKSGKWQQVVDFLDLSLLKDLVYLNIVFGISFALSSDGAFATLLPMYVFSLGFSTSQLAHLVALAAATDVVARIFLTILCLFVQIKARHIFFIGASLTIIFRLAFLTVSDFTGIAIIVGALNFIHTFLHLPVPLVLAEHLPPERFAAGYGLFIFLQGNSIFVIGPIVGWIRDFTSSYVYCFNALTFVMGLCVIPWMFEMIWFKVYSKNTINGNKV